LKVRSDTVPVLLIVSGPHTKFPVRDIDLLVAYTVFVIIVFIVEIVRAGNVATAPVFELFLNVIFCPAVPFIVGVPAKIETILPDPVTLNIIDLLSVKVPLFVNVRGAVVLLIAVVAVPAAITTALSPNISLLKTTPLLSSIINPVVPFIVKLHAVAVIVATPDPT
jgi:hypothetical protein